MQQHDDEEQSEPSKSSNPEKDEQNLKLQGDFVSCIVAANAAIDHQLEALNLLPDHGALYSDDENDFKMVIDFLLSKNAKWMRESPARLKAFQTMCRHYQLDFS